jgi:hypothetical protein
MARATLQTLLESMCPHVYFQPPSNVQLQYPCIIYKRSDEVVKYADNGRFNEHLRYEVTIIDRDPDSPIPRALKAIPLVSYDRFFAADDLNHDVFNLYWKESE